jgi:heme O synthase-like polyprenyltransferase
MKKYFNIAIATQIICVLYTIIHNFIYLSQYVMFAVFGLGMLVSLFLYWQCFTNKELTKNQKWVGLFLASIPIICILIFIVVLLIYANGNHC